MSVLVPGVDITYEEAVSVITNGSASVDQINAICNEWGVTPYEYYKDFKGNTAYQFYRTKDGTIKAIGGIGGDTVTSGGASTIEQTINSNAGSETATKVTTKTRTPVNTSLDGQGKVNATTQMKDVLNRPLTNGKFSVASIGYASAAVGVGLKLGKAFDSTLYNLNPDFFDEHGMSTLNPETWNSVTSDISEDDPWYVRASGTALNTILGIDTETNKATMYMDENAIAYMAAYLQSMNALEGETVVPEPLEPSDSYTITSYIPAETMIDTLYSRTNGYDGLTAPTKQMILDELPSEIADNLADYTALVGYTSTSTPTAEIYFINTNGPTYRIADEGQLIADTYNDIFLLRLFYASTEPTVYAYGNVISAAYSFRDGAYDTYTWMLNGTFYDVGRLGLRGWSAERTAIEGITTQSGATVPDLSGIPDPTDISDVLAALKAQLPDLFDDADGIKTTVIDEDGNEEETVYFPVPFPTVNPDDLTQPTGDGVYSGQTDPSIDPDTTPDEFLQNLVNTIISSPDTTPNPTDTGTGTTPVVALPEGSAEALFAVYNPTQAQVNSFGAWLWSANFADQLLKIFNDPMESIISLHKVFATPSTGGAQNIYVGYLDSGVSSLTVSAQYATVDCGTVSLAEAFGNVLDYTGTSVSIYLPFVGIVPLDVSDVMRATISVIYHVDVLTGACLVDVDVTRDLGGGTLYQYAGDCAVHYPLSSGSYMGIVSGLLSIAGGIAGTVASGGSLAPVALGAMSATMGAHTNVQRTGGFSGNAGAMGSKKPYLIVSRPQGAMSEAYLALEGVGSNHYVPLSSCSGLVKIKEVQLTGVPAFEKELDEIRGLLMEGVIV